MSNIGYFSELFHSLGDLAIQLNDALNLLVRSYRTEVAAKQKKEAEKILLSFLDLALERDKKLESPWPQATQLKEILDDYLVKRKGVQSKLDLIHQRVQSGMPLSKYEIQLLDDVISQVNQQATIAFRKMRKVG